MITEPITYESTNIIRERQEKFINLKEAAIWASQYLNRNITISNISYLLQYGRIKKYAGNGSPLINIEELKEYYDSYNKEQQWKQKLGEFEIGPLTNV